MCAVAVNVPYYSQIQWETLSLSRALELSIFVRERAYINRVLRASKVHKRDLLACCNSLVKRGGARSRVTCPDDVAFRPTWFAGLCICCRAKQLRNITKYCAHPEAATQWRLLCKTAIAQCILLSQQHNSRLVDSDRSELVQHAREDI